ncbi:MAG: hypothetical protein KF799_00785 [Bdellovibrionales bacterium]|nr:hypothetical protein [Bdellovibrionales bacterium]
MLKFLSITLILLSSTTVLAAEKKSSSKKDSSINGEAFLTYDSGKYEFEDKGDKGSFNAGGLGVRAGFSIPLLFIGAEALYGIPVFRSSTNVNTTTSDKYFKADDESLNLGGTLILKLGPMRILGTAYLYSQAKGKVHSMTAFGEDATYERNGTGSRYGMDVTLFKGLNIGIGGFNYHYSTHSIDRDINSFTKVSGAKSPMTASGTYYTISWTHAID